MSSNAMKVRLTEKSVFEHGESYPRRRTVHASDILPRAIRSRPIRSAFSEEPRCRHGAGALATRGCFSAESIGGQRAVRAPRGCSFTGPCARPSQAPATSNTAMLARQNQRREAVGSHLGQLMTTESTTTARPTSARPWPRRGTRRRASLAGIRFVGSDFPVTLSPRFCSMAGLGWAGHASASATVDLAPRVGGVGRAVRAARGRHRVAGVPFRARGTPRLRGARRAAAPGTHGRATLAFGGRLTDPSRGERPRTVWSARHARVARPARVRSINRSSRARRTRDGSSGSCAGGARRYRSPVLRPEARPTRMTT